MDINIEERIKELQKDSKFFFKQTEEIIDIIYRQALEDCATSNVTNDLQDKIAQEINDEIADKVIFNVKKSNGRDLKYELDEALKVVKSQDEKIEEQEQKIKKLNSQIYDLKEKQKKSFPKRSETVMSSENMNNNFQSGMVTGLKFAIMAMEGHNIQEAYATIVKKYNEVVKPKDNWP